MQQPNPYLALPGRGIYSHISIVSTTVCRLYLADDHLLQVAQDRLTETYLRFYFRDIQAFLIRRTPWRTLYLWISAFFVAVFTLIAISIWSPS